MLFMPIKNTFIHFCRYDNSESQRRRSTSAPPRVVFKENNVGNQHRSGGQSVSKQSRNSSHWMEQEEKLKDEHVLKEFASIARRERWVSWSMRISQRNKRLLQCWQSLTHRLTTAAAKPRIAVIISRRSFNNIVQHFIRYVDLFRFHAFSIFRPSGSDKVEIWLREWMKHAPSISMILKAAENFNNLCRQCQVLLRLPGGNMYGLPWSPSFPVARLHAQAAHDCAIPTEKQRLLCLGKDVVEETLGEANIMPGDLLIIISKE